MKKKKKSGGQELWSMPKKKSVVLSASVLCAGMKHQEVASGPHRWGISDLNF